MDEEEQRVIDNIAQYGCHIIHVMEEGEFPRFTYSIGIEKCTGRPDVIIMGLKPELAQWMINEYNNRVMTGETFIPSKYYQGFLGDFDVTFLDMAKENYEEYLGWGLWYNKGDDFNMLQLVFPSTTGIWPWDADVPDDFLWFQPLLSIHADKAN